MPMLVRRTLSIDSFFVRVRARLRLTYKGDPVGKSHRCNSASCLGDGWIWSGWAWRVV